MHRDNIELILVTLYSFGECSPPKNSFLQLSHNKLSYTRLFQNHEFSPLSTFTISSKVNSILSHCLSPYINPRIRFVVLQNRPDFI